MSLSNLYCFGCQAFLVIDTTAPLPRSQSKSNKMNENFNNINRTTQSSSDSKEEKTVIPDEDSLGPVSQYKN